MSIVSSCQFSKFVFWARIVKNKFYLKGWGWNRILSLWYHNEKFGYYYKMYHILRHLGCYNIDQIKR